MVKYIRYKIYIHTSRFPETGPNHIAWLKQILTKKNAYKCWTRTKTNPAIDWRLTRNNSAEYEQKQPLTEDWPFMPHYPPITLSMPFSHVPCWCCHVTILTSVYVALFLGHSRKCTQFREPLVFNKVISSMTKDYMKDFAKTLTISHRRQCGKSQGRSLSAYRRAHTRAQALFFKKDHNVHIITS